MTTETLQVLIPLVLAIFTAGLFSAGQPKRPAPIAFALLALLAGGLLTYYIAPFEHVLVLAVTVGLLGAFVFAGRRAQPATQGVGEEDVMNHDPKNEAHGLGDQQEKKRGFLSRGKNAAPDSTAGNGPPPDILAQLAKEPVDTAADYNTIAHLKKRLMEIHEEIGPAAAEPPSRPTPDSEPPANAAISQGPARHTSGRDESEQERESFMTGQETHDGQAGENTTENQASPLKLTPEEIKKILAHSVKSLDDDLSLMALAAEPPAEKTPPPVPEREPIRQAPPVHRAPPPVPAKSGLNGGDELDDLIQQLSDASQLPAEPAEPVAYEDAYDFTLPDLGEPVPYREEPVQSLSEPVVGEMMPEPSFEEDEEPDAPFAPEEPAAETTSIDILLREAGYPLLAEYALLHQIAIADTTMVDFLLNNAYANSMLFAQSAVFFHAACAKTLLDEADCLERSGQMDRAVSLTVQICIVCVDSDLTMSAYHLLRRLCQMTGDEETPKRVLEQMLTKERKILDMLG